MQCLQLLKEMERFAFRLELHLVSYQSVVALFWKKPQKLCGTSEELTSRLYIEASYESLTYFYSVKWTEIKYAYFNVDMIFTVSLVYRGAQV